MFLRHKSGAPIINVPLDNWNGPNLNMKWREKRVGRFSPPRKSFVLWGRLCFITFPLSGCQGPLLGLFLSRWFTARRGSSFELLGRSLFLSNQRRKGCGWLRCNNAPSLTEMEVCFPFICTLFVSDHISSYIEPWRMFRHGQLSRIHVSCVSSALRWHNYRSELPKFVIY